MRLLSIDNVKPGMRLAHSIYTADGRVLLAEGVTLSDIYLNRLRQMGISCLYIADRLIGKVEVDELLKVQTRLEAIKLTKDINGKIRDGQTWGGGKVRQVISDIVDEIVSNRHILYSMIDIRAMNDYHFSHNLTVCILALMTGMAAGYNYTRLKDLGTGAILHDLGKVFISDQLLNKVEKLTPEEFQEIQKHTTLGYNSLSKKMEISSTSAHVAWEHHERFDGGGYPRGLKGSEIHEYARITALADVYDALSTDRVYRQRFMPHEVIEYIRDKGKFFFDPELSQIFLSNIAPFPIGTLVLLNSGEKAIVTKVEKSFPARPEVKIIFDASGSLLPEAVDKDLKKDLTLFIVEGIKEEN